MTNTLLTLHDPELARRYYAEGLWRRDTLYSLLCGYAERRPQAFALRDGTRRLTWRELLAMVDAVAADLHMAGLKRGERVSVWLPNRVESVAILLACSRQGYVCNPSLHQNYRSARSSNCCRGSVRRPCSPSPGMAPTPASPTSSPPRRRCRRCAASTRSVTARAASRPFRQIARRCRRPTLTLIRSSISPSLPGRPARPKASCIPTTPCSRTAG
jgi:hypothetical protein